MNKINTVNKLRQCFANIIPERDGRTNTSPLEYIIGLIFCYLGDTECTSLEAIRRSMKNLTQKNICRNSFWVRGLSFLKKKLKPRTDFPERERSMG